MTSMWGVTARREKLPCSTCAPLRLHTSPARARPAEVSDRRATRRDLNFTAAAWPAFSGAVNAGEVAAENRRKVAVWMNAAEAAAPSWCASSCPATGREAQDLWAFLKACESICRGGLERQSIITFSCLCSVLSRLVSLLRRSANMINYLWYVSMSCHQHRKYSSGVLYHSLSYV